MSDTVEFTRTCPGCGEDVLMTSNQRIQHLGDVSNITTDHECPKEPT